MRLQVMIVAVHGHNYPISLPKLGYVLLVGMLTFIMLLQELSQLMLGERLTRHS